MNFLKVQAIRVRHSNCKEETAFCDHFGTGSNWLHWLNYNTWHICFYKNWFGTLHNWSHKPNDNIFSVHIKTFPLYIQTYLSSTYYKWIHFWIAEDTQSMQKQKFEWLTECFYLSLVRSIWNSPSTWALKVESFVMSIYRSIKKSRKYKFKFSAVSSHSFNV